MSRLLLDLGNTRLKWSLAEEAADGSFALGPVQALAHGGPDFLPALQQRLRGLPELRSAHLVSVAGDDLSAAVCHCLESSLRLREGGVIRERTAARAGPLVCAYAQPSRLGTDRWLSLRGALQRVPPPLLVVSAGTALTVDAVDADCRHLGGLILAGISVLGDALLKRAPHLELEHWRPRQEHQAGSEAEPFWAADTAPALAMAPWQAAAGLVERAARRLHHDCGRAPAVLLAGGDAEALSGLLGIPARVEPDLVLQGLLAAATESPG